MLQRIKQDEVFLHFVTLSSKSTFRVIGKLILTIGDFWLARNFVNTWNMSGQPKVEHIFKNELEKKSMAHAYFSCGKKYSL